MDTDCYERLLTPEDLVTIAAVYEETKYATKDETLPGIVLVRGPETGHLFPRNGRPAFQSVGRIGTKRAIAGRGVGASGPERHDERFISRDFVGSLRWPKGLPVGMTIHHTKIEIGGSKYEPTAGTCDVPYAEYKRLKSLAYMKTHMTQRERLIDEARKEAVRMSRESADSTALVDFFATAMANAAGKVAVPVPAPAPTPPKRKKRKPGGWDRLTEEQRAERVAKMQAGRLAKAEAGE